MEKYFKFEGSATRSEYWAVTLIGGFCAFILAFFSAIIAFGELGALATIIGGIFLAATIIGAFWLSIATTMRRCRNAGLNTWWTLAIIIPYVGWIVTIVLGCLKTDEGTK
jgi:uncharacterized membrane protein YhaH (DUF805 family)